jgi:hypothetical protein
MAQEGQTPQPGGQTQPQGTLMGSQEMPHMMEQLQDTMEQIRAQMTKKDKMTAVDLRKMQDMLNQMQG